MLFTVKKHTNVYLKTIQGKDIFRDFDEVLFRISEHNVDYFLGCSPLDVNLDLEIDWEFCTFYKEVECEF